MDVISRQFLIYTLRLPQLPEFPALRKKGALLRWNLANGDFLFADLLTWSEFGQDSLEKEISHFRKGEESEVLNALWLQAKWEYSARLQGKVLQRANVKQHYLISHISQTMPMDLAQDRPIKLKFSGEQFKNGIEIPDWIRGCASPIRLDLNLSFDESLFNKFWQALSEDFKSRIEFIEDPFKYDEKLWDQWNDKVPLALDWAETPEKASRGYSYLVVKSASQDVFRLLENQQFKDKNWVFTHSFDSIVGRTYCESLAHVVQEKLGSKLKACGFQPPEPMVGDFDFTPDKTAPGIGFQNAFKNLLWSNS